MGALNRVYGIETRRSWRRRMGVSTVLALAVGACWLGAIAVVVVTPLLSATSAAALALLLFLARWAARACCCCWRWRCCCTTRPSGARRWTG